MGRPPAKYVRDLSDADLAGMQLGVSHYVELAKLHAARWRYGEADAALERRAARLLSAASSPPPRAACNRPTPSIGGIVRLLGSAGRLGARAWCLTSRARREIASCASASIEPPPRRATSGKPRISCSNAPSPPAPSGQQPIGAPAQRRIGGDRRSDPGRLLERQLLYRARRQRGNSPRVAQPPTRPTARQAERRGAWARIAPS
jgi:hypothetical protein